MKVTDALVSLTDQILHLLEVIEPENYRRPLDEFDGSSLGQHFRHILEFFQCLETGLRDGSTVDYASRARRMIYEDSPAAAAGAFDDFLFALEKIDCERVVSVRAEFGSHDRPEYRSTAGRELMFVYDHAIHHLAMIKVGLRTNFPEVRVGKNLGVSPSTTKHRTFVAN